MKMPRWVTASSFILLLLLLAFSQWFVKIADYDFWWHIKTGQYILEHKGLPDEDPFSFTFLAHDTEAPERATVILKSYWLSQIILYLVYAYGGGAGILLFKSLVFSLLLLGLWRYLAFRSASEPISFLLLAALIFFTKEYLGERPQIFSFLFAALCFILLDAARSGKKSYLFLPPLMLLWANMHGGFLVGIAFILVYACCLAVRKQPWREKYPVLFIYLLSVLITLLNPASYHTVTGFISFQESILMQESFEFQSPLKNLAYLTVNWYPLAGCMLMGYLAMGIEAIRRVQRKPALLQAEHILLLAGTSVAAYSSARYGYFFMIVAVPVLAQWLTNMLPIRPFRSAPFVFLPVVVCLAYASPMVSTLRSGVMIDRAAIPVEAVEFIKAKALPPKIYNDIVIGGYMIWRLYPDYQVFSDTRTLNPEIYRQYMSILGGNTNTFFGVPEWKALLDMYGIRTVIHGTVNPYSGDIYPLMLNLLRDDAWHLVYRDGIVAVMTKDLRPGLAELPKDMLLQQMGWEIERGLRQSPAHQGFLRSRDMLSRLP
ncbi:MAG: hypothetical protein ACYC69_11280 [Thermodesulfovibrionales bacterium]